MGLSKGVYDGLVAIQIGQEGDELACKFGKSAAKGTPQVTVLCEVASGPRIGESMEWTGYFSGGATDGTIRNLRALGFEGDDLDAFADQRPTKAFQFTVDDDEYNGKVRQKIVRIGTDTSLKAPELKALANELRGKLSQFKGSDESALGADEPPF
jgi:hypothetical protein